MPWSAIGSELESMLGSVLERVLGSVIDSVLGSVIESVLGSVIESVVVRKRLPPLQSHAFEWVRDWVRVIAALHHAIDKVE